MHTNAAWVYIWCAQNHTIKNSCAHIHAHKYPYMQLSIHRGFFILFIYHSLKEEYSPSLYVFFLFLVKASLCWCKTHPTNVHCHASMHVCVWLCGWRCTRIKQLWKFDFSNNFWLTIQFLIIRIQKHIVSMVNHTLFLF